ncbi:MAG TPA: peptidoglycan bridge formation glycyltransferase FemA/FemB family protein [bacterium]|jgi:lipid II:glycine glycyltransferase (peptidoglycan interpeptide bridge formation enzyme)|nr:peptidoglycan bridge formation glycyltransferase FemA/FemB family protein [bacterium]HPM27971.1 peptidoglycan bridge formation glycyltransferase FemA/FemB family protein [bacterium]
MYQSILQTRGWGALKEKYGQKPHWISDVLVLEVNLPLKKRFLYMPEIDQVQLHDMDKAKIDELAKKCDAIFVRVEIVNPTTARAGYLNESLRDFIKSKNEIQPKHRRVVDIRLPEERLLGQMKPKGRYNIRVSQKHNVEVKNFGPVAEHRATAINQEMQFWGRSYNKISTQKENAKDDAIAQFYALYKETIRREKITGRSIDYFYDLVDLLGADNKARVFIAYAEGVPLAGAIVTFCGGVASYLYGGSRRDQNNVMAPFGLHWAIMQEAKKRNCHTYDLLGIAPEDESNHKWAGLSRFKENFGGKAIEILGGYDKVYHPKWYKIFNYFKR